MRRSAATAGLGSRRRARGISSGLFSLLGLVSAPHSVEGQLRRDAVVQPVSDVRGGDLLLGLGVTTSIDGRFPLAGWSGDVWSLGVVQLAYGLGDRAVFEIRGAVRQVLRAQREGEPAVVLDPSAEDGTASDSGDFELSVSFLPLGGREGFSAGGHVAVKLPNTDETLGIGPNTTDVTIAAMSSWGARRWRATGLLGVGILEAPLRSFEQNDVLVYAVEWVLRPREQLRVAVGARGRASTRGRVPLGTEDLGQVRLDAEWRLGRVSLDVGAGRGFAGNSPRWEVRGGVAWSLAPAR